MPSLTNINIQESFGGVITLDKNLISINVSQEELQGQVFGLR